jgi:hypothetical protein
MKQAELHFFSIRTVPGDNNVPRFRRLFNQWFILQFLFAIAIHLLTKAQSYAGMDLYPLLVLVNIASVIAIAMIGYYAIRWFLSWLLAPKDKVEIVG